MRLWIPIALLLAGCVETPGNVWDPSWKKVWEDNFDGEANTPPNPEYWTHDVGGDGWGNNQLEFNTDRVENSFHDGNGNLVIRAIREDYEGNSWTSARLITRDKFEHGFGRFEARIKFPAGQGLWPAFWLLGSDFPEVGWPTCGEIDIVEIRGERPNEVVTTVHGPGYSGGEGAGELTVLPGFTAADGFHVYAVEIDDEHLSWYIDEDLVHRVHPGNLPEFTPWVFNKEFFMILNLAVGGNFLAQPTDSTPSPAEVTVDWVRVWERKNPVIGDTGLY